MFDAKETLKKIIYWLHCKAAAEVIYFLDAMHHEKDFMMWPKCCQTPASKLSWAPGSNRDGILLVSKSVNWTDHGTRYWIEKENFWSSPER